MFDIYNLNFMHNNHDSMFQNNKHYNYIMITITTFTEAGGELTTEVISEQVEMSLGTDQPLSS
jgi:hypothetical protein